MALTPSSETFANVKSNRRDLILFDYLKLQINGSEFYHKVKQLAHASTFDSKFVLITPLNLLQMLAKFSEIMDNRR